jgi:hypothetical protein
MRDPRSLAIIALIAVAHAWVVAPTIASTALASAARHREAPVPDRALDGDPQPHESQ